MPKKKTRYTLEAMLEEARLASTAAGEVSQADAKPQPLTMKKNGSKIVTKELVERIIEKVERI
ncbi:MAG: hypothetical protein OEV06_07345 [Anaerolineae bacterium]|nr:hypothetical protein [Anaerolineae bacterium]